MGVNILYVSVFCGGTDLPSTPPPDPHIHTLESKQKKKSTLECKENDQILKNSDYKNVNKRKNRLTLLKLESKKHDKKTLAPRKVLGGAIP